MSPALAKAIQVIQQELGKYEHNAMTGGGGDQKVVEIEVEPASTHLAEGEDDGGGQHACPDCAAGTCTNPDHASDEEYDQMMT